MTHFSGAGLRDSDVDGSKAISQENWPRKLAKETDQVNSQGH
jgi:hypothetical protein